MTDPQRFAEGAPADISSADLLRECGLKLTHPGLWRLFQERFHRTLVTYVMRVMWNRFRVESLEDDACDLVQDVYLRLLMDNGRLLRSFQGITDFAVRAFLARVTLSVVTDHYRAEQTLKRRPAEIVSIQEARKQGRDLQGEAADLDITSILSWIDVEKLMESESDHRNAARNVLIFKLHYVDQFTVREIAQFPAFKLKEGAIDLILQNLRSLLRKRLGR